MRTHFRLSIFISLSIPFYFCNPIFNTGSNSNALPFLLGLGGGSPSVANLQPGTVVDLSGNGAYTGILLDSDGDGISDGIDLTGDGIPNFLLLDSNDDNIPDAVDTNGDGIANYFINPKPPAFLTSGPGGSGNPVVAIVDSNGSLIGFDTDGDGTANDTLVASILRDSASPTLTSSLSSGTYSTTQTTTLTCSDNLAPGDIVYTLDGSTPRFNPKQGIILSPPSKSISLSSEGNHTLTAFCRDLNGNISATIQISYTIDTSVPALSISSQSSLAVSSQAGAISSSTAVWRTNRSGSYTIYEGSSCSGTSIASGSAIANQDNSFIRSYANFSGEGTKLFQICVTGSNGLVGFVSFALQRDDTRPVVSASPSTGNYSSALMVTVGCSDVGGAGCDKIAYTKQIGSSPTNPAIQGNTGNVTSGLVYSSAIEISDEAITHTKYVARDRAGNISNVISQTYTVDSQVANITVNSFTSAVNGSNNVSISWKSSKAGSYQIRVGGSTCETGTALLNSSGNLNVSGSASVATDIISTIANSFLSEGDNTIRLCVSNLIGSFGSTTRSIRKDTTAPSVTLAAPLGSGPFNSGTQLQLTCSDSSGSGCDKIIYTLNGTDPTFDSGGSVTNGTVYTSSFALSNGNNQVKFRGIDLAGNISSITTQAFYIGPPVVLSTVVGSGQLTINFTTVSGATGYKLYYGTNPGITTSNLSVSGISSPIVLTGLTNDTTYYLRLALIAGYGESSLGTETFNTPSSLPLVDYCIIQYPSSLTLTRNSTATAPNYIYVQLYQAGVTDPTPADSRVRVQIGYGPNDSNPMTEPHRWTYFPTTFNSSCMFCANNDEYWSLITAPPSPGTYKYVGKVSISGIARETYCDLDGNGSNPGFPMTFSTSQLGVLTVQ